MADYNINAVARRVVFTGSAGLGPYAFTFEILDDDDLAVYFNSTKLTKTTDYTVTINANGTGSVNVIVNAGGNIPQTPTASDSIIIVGARDIERVTDFVTAGDLLASSLNEQLDALTIFDQQVAEEQKRSLQAPVYDPAHVDDGGTLDMTLPAKADRLNKTLMFDSSGNPVAGPTSDEITNAQTYATNASTSADAAAASQVAAANSAAAAASAFDNFDDTYLGSKTSDPTVDNDGDPLTQGDLYFNTTANEMRVYDGANWIAATSAGGVSLILYEYTATSGQTTFSGSDDNAATLSYTANNIQVIMNGVVLDPSDYTATNGTSVVLAAGAAANDLVNIYAFKSFTVADTVSASSGGTFAANVTVSGTVTANQLDTDNIRIDGNTISSTDTNGNLSLDPNGTGLFLPNRTPCFFAELSADQGLTDAVEEVIEFDNEDFDIGGIWDTTNYRLTVDANTVGYYHVSCYVLTNGTNAVNNQYIKLRKNGSVYIENYGAMAFPDTSADFSSQWFSVVIPLLSSGDYADVTIFSDRDSGGATFVNQISTDRSRTYISGFRLGGA